MKRFVLVMIMSVAWSCPAVFAAVLTVGHGSAYQHQTITAAMAAAVEGDQVVVADGTYNASDHLYPETFPIRLKSGVTLMRASNEFMPVIDAEQSDFGVVCDTQITEKPGVIEGFRITGASGLGSGVSVLESRVIIRSCEVSGNTSENSGAGISIMSSDAVLEDCLISGNVSTGPDSCGGGINVFRCESASITGCNVTTNQAQNSGGGINVVDSSVTITDSMIERNQADGPGGGIFFDWFLADRSILIEKTQITGNISGSSGGGLYFSESEVIPWISYCQIESNTSTGQGAGIYFEDLDAVISCSEFSDNESQSLGGAIYGELTDLNVINCLMSRNTGTYGGGVSLTEGRATMFNVLMNANQAAAHGGAIYAKAFELKVIHSTFEGNTAATNGGAVAVISADLLISSSILWNNSEPVLSEGSSDVVVEYTNIQGNHSGTGNSADDPLFTMCMLCGFSHFLSHTATGQTKNSPCIDAGKFSSDETLIDAGVSVFRLSDTSTRTDRYPDTGMSDRGFHYFPNANECHRTGCEIIMPASGFASGDECYCDVAICNSSIDTIEDVPLFVLLDIAGMLFFAPEFNDFSYYPMTIHPGVQFIHVIPRFVWPENAGSFSGAYWYAAMTDPDITELFGLMGTFEFGWH